MVQRDLDRESEEVHDEDHGKPDGPGVFPVSAGV